MCRYPFGRTTRTVSNGFVCFKLKYSTNVYITCSLQTERGTGVGGFTPPESPRAGVLRGSNGSFGAQDGERGGGGGSRGDTMLLHLICVQVKAADVRQHGV